MQSRLAFSPATGQFALGHTLMQALVGLILAWSGLVQAAGAADATGLRVKSISLQGQPASSLAGVLLRAPGQANPQPQNLATGQVLPPGTEISLPSGASAVLVSQNNNAVTLFPGASFVVGTVTEHGESHQPLAGKIEFQVRQALDFYNVSYNRFTAAVKGTAYSVEISPAQQTIEFHVTEGEVEVDQRLPLRVRGRVEEASDDEPLTVGAAELHLTDSLVSGERRKYDLNVESYLKEFGNYAEVETYFNEALAAAERSGDGRKIHSAVINLMAAYNATGQAQSTLDLAQRCQSAAQSAGTRAAAAVAANRCNTFLGNGYQLLGRYRQAIESFEKVLETERSRGRGRTGIRVAVTLNNLAIAYQALGELDRALALLTESSKMREQIEGPVDSLGIARSRSNLARLHFQRGNLQQAVALYQQAIAMTRKVQQGADHPDLASQLAGLGAVYTELGDFPGATRQYEQALAMVRSLFPGREHLASATYLSSLGFVKYREGKAAEARRLAEESLAIRRRLLGEVNHPAIAVNLSELGLALIDLGEQALATQRLEEALAMNIQIFGNRDHPAIATSLNNLSLARAKAGELDAALDLQQRALKMEQAVYGDIDHPAIARSLINMGNLYLRQKQLAKAINVYERGIVMRRQLYGDRPHPGLASSLVALAQAVLQAGNVQRALALQLEALAIRERLYGKLAHRDTLASLRAVADLSIKAGLAQDGAGYRERANAMQLQLPPQ